MAAVSSVAVEEVLLVATSGSSCSSSICAETVEVTVIANFHLNYMIVIGSSDRSGRKIGHECGDSSKWQWQL